MKKTRLSLTGTSFLIVFLVLWGSAYTLPLLLLLVFVPSLRLIWGKPHHRLAWRTGSLLWLLFALAAGVYAGEFHEVARGGYLWIGWPFSYPWAALSNEGPIDLGTAWDYGWINALNIFVVSGVLMLPLTIGSWYSSTRKMRGLLGAPRVVMRGSSEQP